MHWIALQKDKLLQKMFYTVFITDLYNDTPKFPKGSKLLNK